MRAQNKEFNVKIEKNIDANIKPILGNQQSIGRVFLNVVNNAFYATHEKAAKNNGSYSPTLTVSTEQNEEYVTIKIKDNGTGIPDAVREKIFEPFFTTKPAGQGTGLGLPICYDIVVKEHNGKLDIATTPGEYTEFILMFPKELKS
jgi:signal transduction histidine kinase